LKEFIDELSKLIKNQYRDLVEKDILLFKILFHLSQNEFFYKNFLLKGGTCLIKNYLEYYRFSEDIDFTWKNQNIFKNKSRRQLRRKISELIDEIGKIIEEICIKYNLDFINNKGNEKYFQFGGGNKMVTFKLYYISEILNNEVFVKIQINFIECLKFKSKRGIIQNPIPKSEELKFLYPKEYEQYSKKITIPIYNIKEILCEKVRAILTRIGTKARDFVDIYMILKKNKFNIKDLRDQIIEKTIFVLNRYDKFKKNLNEKKELIISGDLFTWGEERKLLLIKIDNKDFYNFVNQFNIFLKNITEEIYKKIPNIE